MSGCGAGSSKGYIKGQTRAAARLTFHSRRRVVKSHRTGRPPGRAIDPIPGGWVRLTRGADYVGELELEDRDLVAADPGRLGGTHLVGGLGAQAVGAFL